MMSVYISLLLGILLCAVKAAVPYNRQACANSSTS